MLGKTEPSRVRRSLGLHPATRDIPPACPVRVGPSAQLHWGCRSQGRFNGTSETRALPTVCPPDRRPSHTPNKPGVGFMWEAVEGCWGWEIRTSSNFRAPLPAAVAGHSSVESGSMSSRPALSGWPGTIIRSDAGGSTRVACISAGPSGGRSSGGFLGRGGRGPVGTAHLAQQRGGFEPLTVSSAVFA